MTYALLIYRATPADEAFDERATLAGHRALQAQSGAAGRLHAVARLGDPAGARTLRRGANVHELTDGPFAETKEWLVGFYLLDCVDEHEALACAEQICTDHRHVIEIRPVTWRWKGA